MIINNMKMAVKLKPLAYKEKVQSRTITAQPEMGNGSSGIFIAGRFI